MAKKSQASLSHPAPEAAAHVDFSDEKTKPNIRLVQAMSGRPQFAKKKITVEAPATHPVATPLVIKLIPYAFGVLMAFGFAHLQTGRPSRAKSAKAAVEKELRTTSPYASPILETVRSASNKR